MKLNSMTLRLGAALFAISAGLAQAQMPPAPTPLKAEAARMTSAAAQAPMLGAAKAGKRLVAVGDYGIVLLSDDAGKTFRQAKTPVSSTLTAVNFADDKHGWAVGQWGAILNTSDGGETWAIQRLETQEDRPLFSVHFFDAHEGIAVGLWSLVLKTTDGGKTWNPLNLPAPPDGGRADRNLFKLFASDKGSLFVAAERGMVLRSNDRGQSWHYLDTGYKGSLWSGVALTDGSLLVAGLRGTIYRSADDGKSWQPVISGSKSSVTDLVQSGPRVVGSALDGVMLDSADGGKSFSWQQRDDRLSLTAVLAGEKSVIRFSRRGALAPDVQ